MITEDEVMRLLERADPARSSHTIPDADAAGYLAALRTRSTTVTLIGTEPTPTRPEHRHHWPIIAVAAAAAVVAIVVGGLVLAPAMTTRTNRFPPPPPSPPTRACQRRRPRKSLAGSSTPTSPPTPIGRSPISPTTSLPRRTFGGHRRGSVGTSPGWRRRGSSGTCTIASDTTVPPKILGHLMTLLWLRRASRSAPWCAAVSTSTHSAPTPSGSARTMSPGISPFATERSSRHLGMGGCGRNSSATRRGDRSPTGSGPNIPTTSWSCTATLPKTGRRVPTRRSGSGSSAPRTTCRPC